MDALCDFCREIDFSSLFFKDLEARSYEHDGYSGSKRQQAPSCNQDGLFLGNVAEVRNRAKRGCNFCALIMREGICRVRGKKWKEPGVNEVSYLDLNGMEEETQQWLVYLTARNTAVQAGRSAKEVLLPDSLVPAESKQYRDINQQSAYLYAFLTPSDNFGAITRNDSDPTHTFLIHPLDHPRSLLRKVPPKVDFQAIKTWLDQCIRSHEICRSKAGGHLQQSYFPKKISILPKPGNVPRIFNRYFKLIDVQKRDIVEMGVLTSTPSYAVLSYVWGNIPKEYMLHESLTWIADSNGRKRTPLTTGIPDTILDAINVTDRLGLVYLWVDSLCITQDNVEEKAVQIQDMTSVYQNASVCLVAASGDSANDGLAGVSKSRAGRAQTAVQVRPDLTVGVTDAESLHVQLGHSKWINRAWTFQEQLLSRRLLIFTSEEVYYRCTCVMYRESLLEDAADKSAAWLRENKSEQYLETYAMMMHREGGVVHSEDPRWYENCLRDYSARGISFDSDSLNAFAGVGKLFEERYRAELVLGLPKSLLLNCLTWESSRDLRRRNNAPSEKEKGPTFPSWTWAAWEGQVWLKPLGDHWLDWVPTKSKIRVLDPIIFHDLPAYEVLCQNFATELKGSPPRRTLSGIMPVVTKLARVNLLEHAGNGIQLGETKILIEDGEHVLLHPNIKTEFPSLPSEGAFIQLCIYSGSFGRYECLAMFVELTEYVIPTNSPLRSLKVSKSFRPIRNAFGVVPVGYKQYEGWRFKREEKNPPKAAYCVDHGLRKFKIPEKVFLARRLGLAIIPFGSWVRARPETACILLG